MREMEKELCQYQHLILANGEFPNHPIHTHLFENAKAIVCCDGAIEKLLQTKFQPTAIVGDGDSISPELKSRYHTIFHLDKDESVNDLNKALRYYLRMGIRRVAILGAFGLREDHALANLGVMMLFAEKEKMEIMMIGNHGVFTTATESVTLNSFPGQQISLFSFRSETIFSFQGLKYPVRKQSFDYLYEASLNEAIGVKFSVSFNKGRVLIYRSFE